MTIQQRLSGGDALAPSRRGFLAIAGGAGVGLMIGFKAAPVAAEAAAGAPLSFNPFVKVSPDGAITVVVKHLDMGQGPTTGLATLIAEEMDADWSQMRTEFAPADATLYANLAFKAQGTGGSTAMANSWEQYRTAGATARAMLVKAAADKWQVSQGEIVVDKGLLSHPSGKKGSYGEFAEDASKLPAPIGMAQETPFKDPSKFKLIGKDGLHRIDNDPKTDGTAIYTQDVKLPNMLIAVVAHGPRFGAKVKSFDDAEAKKVKGVEKIVQIPQGVAVLARNTWAAISGRNALKVEWEGGETRGSDELLAMAKDAVSKPGTAIATHKGDAEAALKGATKVIEAEFSFPYLAHAAMEPMNCVVDLKPDGARLIYGAQFQSIDQPTVAAIAGLKPEQVKIETVWAGGSFGRRAVPTADYVAEAVTIAKAIGGSNPVKLVWTREDDTKGGYYRPFYAHKVRAAIGPDGMPIAWHHRIAGQSIFAGTALEAMAVKDGVDDTSVEGASNLAYAVPNLRVELTTLKVGVPVLWWRSVGHTHTAHVVESMIDELAFAAGKDPVEYRLALLKDKPRHTAALKLAAEKAEWKAGEKLEKGKGRGVAVHESFNSVVAQVVDVTIKPDGSIKVDRVVAAVDCGTVINPDVVRAQVEGGVGFGLGAALRNAITLKDGEVVQANFDTYKPLRMSDMPHVEVHTVPSTEKPTGIGEPGVPPIAPALANAIFAATGKRVRDLPLGEQKFTSV